MKKSLIVLSILLVLAVITLPLIDYFGKPPRTERKDFAVANTELVDSIFMVDRAGEFTLLRHRDDGIWTVNGKFNAAPDKIELLLKTLNKIEVKNPVARTAQRQVVADLSVSGITVKIYLQGGKEKIYTVGGPTADETGTFMYMDQSTVPFVVHIPGFNGYLTPRYSTNPLDWRDKAIFATPMDKLEAIVVSYPDSSQNSFELDRNAANIFTVKQNGTEAPGTNQEFAKQYAALFATIGFEAYLGGYSENFTDSLRKAKPRAIISIKRSDKSTVSLKVYYKPITSDTKALYDDKGNLLVYDSDNYYALVDNNPELITVQDFIFRHVFKRYKDFVAE